MFSSRVSAQRTTNRLAAAVASHRRAGHPLIDLTATNPTTCGFDYPADILTSLARTEGRLYRPEPLGLSVAREAVARDYVRRGIGVARERPGTGGIDPARIVITASTSEAYSLLFKLLCEPSGDDVLVPSPSYPLFEHLTTLDGVGVRPYALEYHGRWELDAGSVDAAWTSRTRAVLAVSPNNPTGSVLAAPELAVLSAKAASADAAVIVDEVFADYPLAGGRERLDGPAALPDEALTFRLGGLSKTAGLPQVKLGWIAVSGPDALVEEAIDRLELICDTYLSVSTPVQVAAPDLIERGAIVRAQIQERILKNQATLAAACAACPAMQLLEADGGWSAVVRVPSILPEEELVLELLERRGTLVHPGFFFDFPHEAFLVFSLLPPTEAFSEGVARVVEHLHA